MSVGVRMIPEPWRTRYGDEVAEALANSESRLRDSLDVIAWGVRLRMQRRRTAYRSAVGVALAGALILIWLSLGVGIIGSDGDRANAMYFAVVAVGIIGALIARFRPIGMARALFATAIAQTSVAVIALVARLGYPSSGPLELSLLNGFFVALFVGSALLFRYAAHGRPAVDEGPSGGADGI